ncbi:MAG: hypothetical protein ACI81A_003000 [Paraglaciecola sp.]
MIECLIASRAFKALYRSRFSPVSKMCTIIFDHYNGGVGIEVMQ